MLRPKRSRAGVDEFVICLGYKGFASHVQGDCFFMTYGDAVADIDLGELLSFHRGHGKLATVTAVRPPGRFGAVVRDEIAVMALKTRIPVVAPDTLVERRPDDIVILAWNMADEIMRQMAGVARWGARFVMAIPELQNSRCQMIFLHTRLDGLFMIRPNWQNDTRGSFARLWGRDEFARAGHPFVPVQTSTAWNTLAGTLRGLAEAPPHQETKLVRVVRGQIWGCGRGPQAKLGDCHAMAWIGVGCPGCPRLAGATRLCPWLHHPHRRHRSSVCDGCRL